MLALIVAGEAIFGLPFHITRFFRPLVLTVFGVNNTEIGQAFAVYGAVAMLSYFPGGPLADLFPARRLMTFSLLSTGLGGFFLAGSPTFNGLLWLYGFFGVTSILFFWAALIRATREWGGHDQQGRAYGLLDAGRGLLAAVLATFAVGALSLLLPDPESASELERAGALRGIILLYTGITLLAAAMTWFFIPEAEHGSSEPIERPGLKHVGNILRRPEIWLQALVVICAYVGYKSIDNISLYAFDVWKMNEVEAARMTTITAWVRVVAALGAGLCADRFFGTRVSIVGFVTMAVTLFIFIFISPAVAPVWLVYVNLVVVCSAIFGLRGIYFALFEEAGIPKAMTGTAVGIVSVIGYTPDIFAGYATGWMIDQSPGIEGHRHAFMFVLVFAVMGIVASTGLEVLCHRRGSTDPS